jgi:hypothetical protein
MKPFSEENQLGLASLLNYAAIQSEKTKSSLKRKTGLDANYLTGTPGEEWRSVFS